MLPLKYLKILRICFNYYGIDRRSRIKYYTLAIQESKLHCNKLGDWISSRLTHLSGLTYEIPDELYAVHVNNQYTAQAMNILSDKCLGRLLSTESQRRLNTELYQLHCQLEERLKECFK